ncbi:MAG: response regulator transcription factor [bacterium]
MNNTATEQQTRIVLVDDHILVRAGIRSLLEQLPNIIVVGEANDGREAIRIIRENNPDIVLMDIAMTGLNGLQALEYINQQFPSVQVLILSMHANEEYVLKALRYGASGYLLKESAVNELELALTAIKRGNKYLSPPISRQVIDQYTKRLVDVEESPQPPVNPLDQLTLRQREVLQLIAEGKSTKEIATALNLGVKTVETHRTELMRKLNIHDVTGLVRFAIQVGLISAG